MRKHEELANETSCLNQASAEEMLFVLRGHDPAAPATIRFWIEERIRLEKNGPSDEQIKKAERCANLMEAERWVEELKGKR